MLSLNNAYEYYINNIDNACDKTFQLSKREFEQLFIAWINTIAMQDFELSEIPLLNNCGKSKFISIERIINKIL